jgi:branched-chain amino acid transport system ATP-binding protein
VVEEILGSLSALNREGLPILLVEQKAPLALKIAQRAYLLSVGRVIAEIDPRKVSSYDEIAHYYLS